MERYTIEDVEILRKKSGISYEEAVNLLEYHNGNLARALVDLERNGRINPKAAQKAEQKHHHSEAGAKASNIFTKLFRFRVLVKKGDVTIVNLSVLFTLVASIISPHLLFLSLLLILVLGYRITFDRNSADFSKDNLETMVKNTAHNVRETVSSFAKEIEDKSKKEQKAEEHNDEGGSFYQQGAPMTPPAPPSPTTPVTVQYQSDVRVDVNEDSDGYHEATIE